MGAGIAFVLEWLPRKCSWTFRSSPPVVFHLTMQLQDPVDLSEKAAIEWSRYAKLWEQ